MAATGRPDLTPAPPARRAWRPEQVAVLDGMAWNEREILLETLNHLEVGLALHREDGELLVSNPALVRFLAVPGVSAAVQGLVARLVARVRGRVLRQSLCLERLEENEVHVDGTAFRLRGSHVGFDICGTGTALLVAVDVVGTPPPVAPGQGPRCAPP